MAAAQKARRKCNKVTKYKLASHGCSIIKPELLSMRNKASEILVIDMDGAKKKFPMDDDSLVLERIEKSLQNIRTDITIFLGDN
jgi:hypothetical protein